MPGSIVVYGAYGYTGDLVARRAVERGLAPVLAGRDSEPLSALARELGCAWRAFPLSDPEALRQGIAGAAAVLHCAGPFVRTALPMAEACIEQRVHYVDVTGEIPVFEALLALGPGAASAGVMLLPGAGFDVVPSDCLAAHLVRRLPGARALALLVGGLDRISRGTARTMLEHAGSAARPGAAAPPTRTFELGGRRVSGVLVPWPDTFTAPRSTGVEDVATYVPGGLGVRAFARAAPVLAALLAPRPLRDAAVALLTGGEAGPSAVRRAAGGSFVHGEAVDAAGAQVASTLRGPNPYTFTALAMVEVAERILRGEARPGWQTPSTAYGPDLPLALPGVTREDRPGAARAS